MQIMTYNEALSELCDSFDEMISPRKLGRSNSNVIYLLFKAFAKAWEVINNLCVALNNKFDPVNCTDNELTSLASIVGTEMLKGSASGLLVTIVNNSSEDVALPAGTYSYALDENTVFQTTLSVERLVPAQNSIQIVFLSTVSGNFLVTAQNDIAVTAVDKEGEEVEIPDAFSFSNANNATLAGYPDETVLEFRQRVLDDTERQDIMSELRDSIKNLPYIFDCDIKFNNSLFDIEYDGYTIPPYYMLIMLSGEIKDEIAKVVAEKCIYPTVKTSDDMYAEYANQVFADGRYRVYLTKYRNMEFGVTVTFYADDNFILASQAERQIRTGLFNAVNGNQHKDLITENDIFTIVQNLNITGVKVLGVEINNPLDATNKSYIEFPKTRIPLLTTVDTISATIGGEVVIEPTEPEEPVDPSLPDENEPTGGEGGE